MAAVFAYADPMRVLCVREFQSSIKESFHAELKAAIASEPWLARQYDVGVDYLRVPRNGSEFLFRGLRRSENSIKSLADIDLTIAEEAEDYGESSWLALEATVFRKPKSELWPIWNPRLQGSPVDKRFRLSPPASALIAEMNWSDNPFFPSGLDELRRREQSRLDPNTYAHVWEGAYLTNSNAQVFANKFAVEEFEPQHGWDGPYQGGDFGFAQDPTAAVRCHIEGDTLYVSHEAFGSQLDIDDTARFVSAKIEGFDQYVSRWDNARPESISYLTRHGLPKSISTAKWPGSVEDGIGFLRSFKRIIIHPRCTNLIREFRLYSYKTDRITGDVLPIIIDANNHGIDALRYALSPMIQKKPGAPIAQAATYSTRR